jgi:hypothetical protein
MFQHGHQICEDLGWVKFVGQTVPHRYARVFAQLLNDGLTVTTVFDAVIHTAQHTGGVFH